MFGELCCCGWTSLRWGELVFGRERWCDFPLVGVAVWYFRGTPVVCYFCLLFLGVTVVRAVVSGALPWGWGGRQRAGCLVPLQRVTVRKYPPQRP